MTIKKLNYDTDKDILERIYKYEESIFFESAVGQYNIGPFTKYGRCYAIFDNDHIYSVIEVLFSPESVAYLYGVSTNEKFRKQSYASKLIKYVLDDIKKLNISTVELTVSPDNEIAINFYEKIGFKKFKYLKNEYFDGEDRYLMRMEL